MTKFPAGKEIAVYDLVTLRGSVVYVGITSNPSRRMTAHRRTLPIRGAFVMKIVSRHADVGVARMREAARIKRLAPPFNQRGIWRSKMTAEQKQKAFDALPDEIKAELGSKSTARRIFNPKK